MKTKNIFKTLALAMLMPAMLLTTACSNQDDVANTSNITDKGYALPVTVSATRGGDATRATFDGSKLNFSAGDKLFVGGNHETAGKFAGTLTWQSGGTFSGTIYTKNLYEGTAEGLLSAASSVSAILLPADYDNYDFLTLNTNNGYDATISANNSKTFALTKAAAVEQFSLEGTYSYSNGFTLSPWYGILNFTITGLTPNTDVNVTFSDYTPAEYGNTMGGIVHTDGSGNATFAVAVYAASSKNIHTCTLTVAGNPVTLVNSSKPINAGKIYNITRAVTPPTLAQTMTTAGMTVKVKYNYHNEVNYCLFRSVGDGTYTFQSGYGYTGGDGGCAKALVVEGGKLVFKQNFYDTIDNLWSSHGFSATFDTSNNSYIQFVGPSVQELHNPSFISVEVNSVPIALTKIITVADLVKEDHQSWSVIIDNNSDKIKEDGGYVVRKSDNAKLQCNVWGDNWQDVMSFEDYQSMNTYKFEGD